MAGLAGLGQLAGLASLAGLAGSGLERLGLAGRLRLALGLERCLGGAGCTSLGVGLAGLASLADRMAAGLADATLADIVAASLADATLADSNAVTLVDSMAAGIVGTSLTASGHDRAVALDPWIGTG